MLETTIPGHHTGTASAQNKKREMMMPLMAATDASSEKTAMLMLTDFPAEQPDIDV